MTDVFDILYTPALTQYMNNDTQLVLNLHLITIFLPIQFIKKKIKIHTHDGKPRPILNGFEIWLKRSTLYIYMLNNARQ